MSNRIGHKSSSISLRHLVVLKTSKKSPSNITFDRPKSHQIDIAFLRARASIISSFVNGLDLWQKETSTAPVESLIKPPNPMVFVVLLSAPSKLVFTQVPWGSVHLLTKAWPSLSAGSAPIWDK